MICVHYIGVPAICVSLVLSIQKRLLIIVLNPIPIGDDHYQFLMYMYLIYMHSLQSGPTIWIFIYYIWRKLALYVWFIMFDESLRYLNNNLLCLMKACIICIIIYYVRRKLVLCVVYVCIYNALVPNLCRLLLWTGEFMWMFCE